jgi:UDP-glucose 4-epimerase
MRIFITGVAGFLGSHLADRMLALGHSVIGNDTLIGGYLDNVPEGVEFHQIDCCDIGRMTPLMEGVDIVYHTAATAHEGLSVFSPNFITRNIFQASLSTITSAIKANVRRFVYCTSMARYGSQQTPFTEDMIPMPVDPYGIAKVGGEQCLQALCETHGMEWNIAVPHNIVGPRQRYDDPFRNVMSIMINRNLRGLPAIIYGDGLQTRCFSYIDDVVGCLEKMALDDNIVSQIINVGPDEGTITIKDMAQIVADCTGFKDAPIFMPDRPREVKHAMCSSDKARRLLGYETKTDLVTAVQKTVEYIRQKGPKEFDYSYPLEIISDKTPATWKDRLM